MRDGISVLLGRHTHAFVPSCHLISKTYLCNQTSPVQTVHNAASMTGLLLDNVGAYDEAHKCYEKAMELHPQNADAYVAR